MTITEAFEFIRTHPSVQVRDQSDRRFATATDETHLVYMGGEAFALVRAAYQWGVGDERSSARPLTVEGALDALSDAVYGRRFLAERAALAFLCEATP